MSFSFDDFVRDVRSAAGDSDANASVRSVLSATVSTPGPIADATPVDGEDEIMLFEDESVSIWRCRFQPDVLMPPHEHLLDVHIAGYSGGEKNIMFKKNGDRLEHDETVVVRSGEVISLTKDDIHAVTAEGAVPSLSLHVYMGPLSTLKRGLFDWTSGEVIEFTQENFNKMKRRAAELAQNY